MRDVARTAHRCLSQAPDLKQLSEALKAQDLVKGQICDSVAIYVRSGAGGQGFPSKNGIGGNGGDVYMEAFEQYKNLNHIYYHHSRKFVAERGDNSSLDIIRGHKGENLVIEVPAGTLVTDMVTGETVCDIDHLLERYLIERGMRGGYLANNFIGARAKDRYLKLVLKSIADVGLVGFPNAGKSSLLGLISNASPAVGMYPFTTLKPTVGRYYHDEAGPVAVADIPGLIEGAHENRGLGHVFLQHIERTSVLLFVIDIGGFRLNMKTPHRTPFETFGHLCRELELYMPGMTKRPIIIALNKTDLEDVNAEEEIERFTSLYQNSLSHLIKVRNIVPISCYNGQGLTELREILAKAKIEHSNRHDDSEFHDVFGLET